MRFLKRYSVPVIIITFPILLLCSCNGKQPPSNDELLTKAAELAEAGKWKEARSLATDAVKQDQKDVKAKVMLALAEEKCQQEKAALDEITKACELDPNNFMAQFTRGRMLFEHRRWQDCIAPLTQAYALEPDQIQPVIMLAQANSAMDNPGVALKYYKLMAKNEKYKNKPEPWNEIGIILVNQGRLKSALKFFLKARKLDPDRKSVV